MDQALGFSCCRLCPPAMDSLRCRTICRIIQTHYQNNQLLDPLHLLQLHQGYLPGDWLLYQTHTNHRCIASRLQWQLNYPIYVTQKSHNNLTVSCYQVHENFWDDQMWKASYCSVLWWNLLFNTFSLVHSSQNKCTFSILMITMLGPSKPNIRIWPPHTHTHMKFFSPPVGKQIIGQDCFIGHSLHD